MVCNNYNSSLILSCNEISMHPFYVKLVWHNHNGSLHRHVCTCGQWQIIAYILYGTSFIHILCSQQCNPSLKIKKFHSSTSRHVSAAKGYHQVSCYAKLSLCIKYIKCLFIHTMCKCEVSCSIYLMCTRVLFVLDQFYSLSNLILILRFHKIILAPLLGASSTRPKQSH
jgi:hypothetical protein